jgi:Ferritin-like domain
LLANTATTAYLGAAAGLNSTAVLSAAARIMGAEAYHAGAVREMLLRTKGTPLNAEGGAITVEQAANKISDLRASLSTDSDADDDTGISVTPAPTAAPSGNGGGGVRTRERSLIESLPAPLPPGPGSSGTNDDATTWTPADTNALTFSRTAAQVIKVVTFGADGGIGELRTHY